MLYRPPGRKRIVWIANYFDCVRVPGTEEMLSGDIANNSGGDGDNGSI